MYVYNELHSVSMKTFRGLSLGDAQWPFLIDNVHKLCGVLPNRYLTKYVPNANWLICLYISDVARLFFVIQKEKKHPGLFLPFPNWKTWYRINNKIGPLEFGIDLCLLFSPTEYDSTAFKMVQALLL